MLFNTGRTNDFSPEIKIEQAVLEVVEEMKLLGVIITSDLKWHKNTENIPKKAYSRFWLIKRLKQMGASRSDLIEIYTQKMLEVC